MARLGTPELRQQRRQAIINRLEVLLEPTGTPYDKTRVKKLVNDVTGNTRRADVQVPAGLEGLADSCQLTSDMPAPAPAPAPNVFVLDNWDNENTDPEVVAGFILRNLSNDPVYVLNAQRNGDNISAESSIQKNLNLVANDHYENDVKENASFFVEYENAKTGLNNFLYIKDLNTQRQLLKRFAVANSVFTGDFADGDAAKDFYDHLSQLYTGDCSTVSSVRKTLLAAASLKAGFSKDQTEIILANVNDDIDKDNQYTADRAEVFKGLYDSIMALGGGVTPGIAIKQASVIFNSKKVSQDVVDELKNNAGKRTKFANAVAGIVGDTPEDRNKLAFAAALAGHNNINNGEDIRYFYYYALDTFSTENAKDFEYSSSRAQAFINLWDALDKAGQSPEAAIKKASIIFDSKKVSQDVVDKLKNNAGKRTKFVNAVVDINEKTPEGRNKIAFAAALAADNTDPDFIKYVYNNATDIFSPKNAKDFEYSSSRAKAFINLWDALDKAGQSPEAAIKKASIIFNSKKVSQDVVGILKDPANYNQITIFKDAVAGIDIDINAPEDRNKIAFAAALAADNTDIGIIRGYLDNADNTFQPKNAKDFEYSLDRAQIFKDLYESIVNRGGVTPETAIKQASIVFDSKKVDQRVVNELQTNAARRNNFKNAVVDINGDTPEDRNKIAFAAALAAGGVARANDEIKDECLANATNTFNLEDTKDFEYSYDRARAFIKLYNKFNPADLADKQAAIKKASIIFNSKKVSQDVVNALKDDDDKRTRFANAVADIDEKTPEGRNKIAFAAALTADATININFIKYVCENTPDIFSPKNAKDFEYSCSRAQAFIDLHDALRVAHQSPEAAIKKASIIFDSKKVSQDVVNVLRDDDDKRTIFANAVAGINGDTPEDRNKIAFAAALTAALTANDTIHPGFIKYVYNNATDIFSPKNAKDFEYSLNRTVAFKELYTTMIDNRVAPDIAIKKASIVFDSKKVSQEVVDKLKDNARGERITFASAVVDINGDAPEDRNKIAFAATLAADNTDPDFIKYVYNNATDIFSPKNAKDFEYSSSRAKAFIDLHEALRDAHQSPEVAIKKASIIFDSKKVDQSVVDQLVGNPDNITKFVNVVVNIDEKTPEGKNKIAFAAALVADGMSKENIKKYMECIGDAFSQDIIKNFQITPDRIRTFEQCLHREINDFDNASPTEVSKAIKRFSVLFDADKISDTVVQFIEDDTNGAYTKFTKVTKEDTTNSEYYNKRKAIAAVLSSYNDLNSEQITTILESLSSNLTDTKNSTDFSSNRIEEFAKLVNIVAYKYELKEGNELGGAKLKQITQDLSIIFNPVKVSNKTLENMQTVPDGGNDAVDIHMSDLILNGHFSECCNVLAYGPKKLKDLETEVNKKYKDAITKFKNKLIKQTSLSEETKELVNSNDFLKLEAVSSYLKPEQIESLSKLDSASLRCVAGYLTEMNDKISGGTGKDNNGLLKEISNGLLEILSTEEKAITSETIAKNYNEKIFSISNKVMANVPNHNVDGAGIEDAATRRGNIDNSVNSITTIAVSNRQKLQEFLYACDEFSKGDISTEIGNAVRNNTDSANIEFIKNVATRSLPRFLSLYQKASLNGYSDLDVFYTNFNDIKGKEEDEQSARLSEFCNTIESELNKWITNKNKEDREQDERNKEEELKEKEKINIELVNEIIVRCESNTQKLHKQCLDEEKDIDSPPYATALVKFLQHPETKQDELVKVLSNLGNALKNEEDSQIIFRNIVASNGLIAYKDVLLQEPEKLTPQLLKSMAVDIGNENDTFLVLFDDEEKDKMKDTLCEGKEFEKVVRHGAKEKGKQYRLTKTEWISYLTKNRSKIKDFADLTPEDEIKFKELALLTNSSFVQDKSFCAALSRHISDMKDEDTIIYADAINKLYSIEKDAGHSMKEALENIFNKVNNRLKGGDKDYRRWFSQEELLQLNPTELSHFYDDEYLYRMQAAENADKGELISTIGQEEKDQKQFYNRIILNIDKKNSKVFTKLTQYGVEGVGGTDADGSFSYDQNKVRDYIEGLEQNYEQINSAKEIARALNNCEEATNVKSNVETIQNCVNLEYTTLPAGADAAVKKADSRMEIKLRARNMGGRYKEKVEGKLTGLDKDVEVELLSRLSAMKTETEVTTTLTQLSELYTAYNSFPKSRGHIQDQDEIIKYTIQNLPTNKKILTPTDFQRASLKAILKKQKISVKNQEIIFKNEKRIDFFAKNYLMFKDIDNDELTQILNKSSHEGTSDTAIDHIIEACNDKKVGNGDPQKVEFIFRSSASFNGDHLRHHLKEYSKEQFGENGWYSSYSDNVKQFETTTDNGVATAATTNKALALERAKFYNLSKQNGITPNIGQAPFNWGYDAIRALNKNLYKYENDFKLNGSLIQGVSTLSDGGVVSEKTIRARMAIAYANGGQYNAIYDDYVANHEKKLKSFSTDDLINFGIACVDIKNNKAGALKGSVFNKIKSSQTLAECSRLCVEKRNGKISDEAYKAKVVLALAADSKTDALDQILSNRDTGFYINLNAQETKDTLKNGIKDLNTEQKQDLLERLVQLNGRTTANKYGLDKDFFTNLLQEDCITGVEYQHILKSSKLLHDSKFMKGVRDGLKHNDNVKVYNQIANATQTKDVKDIIEIKIQSTENEIFSYVSPDQRILYEIAGRKLTALATGDAHSVFLNIFEDAELNDPIKKQRYAYAFAFSNQYKNDDGTIGENFSKLLNGLDDKEDRSYIYTAFIEKECRNTKTNKDFAEAVLQIAQVLPDDEKKNEFAGALKKYLEFADKTHNKLDIFDELSKKSETEKDAGILISALLDDNVSLRYGRTDGAVESTIDSAINTMTKNRNIEDQTNILYNLTKSANTQENRYLFLDGIMRHIESLDDKKIQAQLVCNLAKEFTKKENLGTDEDVKLSEQFFVKTARHFADNVDFSINLMNNFNLDNETEEKAQAELLHRFSQYSMPISTEYVINNSNVSQNKYLHDNFEFLDTGDYAKRDARSVDKILEMIGVTEEKDRKEIVRNLRFCSNIKEIKNILNGAIDDHNSRIYDSGAAPIDHITTDEEKRIQNIIASKRKSLLDKLGKGEETIHFSDENLAAVKAGASSQLQWKVNKLKEREASSKRKFGTVQDFKDLHMERAIHAADFLSKLEYYNNAESVANDPVKKEQARAAKIQLLNEQKDEQYSWDGKHWHNFKSNRKHAARGWKRLAWGLLHIPNFVFVGAFAAAWAAWPLGVAIWATIGFGLTGWGAGLLLAAGVIGSIVTTGMQVAGIMNKKRDDAWYQKFNPALWVKKNYQKITDHRNHILEKQYEDAAKATLEKSNRALANADARRIERIPLQKIGNINDPSCKYYNIVENVGITEENKSITSRKLRKIRDTNWSMKYVNPGDKENSNPNRWRPSVWFDRIRHEVGHGTIERTADLTGAQRFVEKKLEKYNKDSLQDYTKALINLKAIRANSNNNQPIVSNKTESEQSITRY